MRLEFTKQGLVKKYIVQGKMEIYLKDPALASVLKRISDGGSIAALGDLGAFGSGLQESFESEKLTIGGRITDKGRAIADTGYNWKGLSGRFIFEVLNLDNKLYLLDCTEYNGQDASTFADISDNFVLSEEYALGNKGYRGISLNPHKQAEPSGKPVTVRLSFDFEKDKTYYSVQDTGIVFENNSGFQHIDYQNACRALSQIVENYGLKTHLGSDVYLNSYDKSNPLLRELIGNLFEKHGSLTAEKNGFEVKDMRLIVDSSEVADELLYEYLSRAAGKQYLGYSEVSALISEFYGFFRHCEYISKNTSGVYAEMLERTSQWNRKAYLRLQACRDIVPDIETSAFRLEVKDLTNTKCTVNDIAVSIVGHASDISSVTMITKYAYKNAAISRAAALLADALKERYNAVLTVITAKDSQYQAEVARVFYDRLKTNKNVTFIERPKHEIEQIHDRYFRITHKNGNVEWAVMTGELDALKFENDFADSRNARTDITHFTEGYIKEMRIINVSEDGIPGSVKAKMAEV